MATLIPVLTVRRSCVIFLLLSAGLALRAQQLDSSETYYAVSAKGYGIADGLPDKCVQNVLVAPDGRLYVLPCTYTQVAHKLHFYQYDAFRARRQAVDIVPATGQWSLVHCGTQRDSTMYGYLLENSDPDQPKTGFFAYHVGKHSWTSRPAPEVDGQPVVLASVAEFKKHLYALGLLAGEAHVFRLQAETWERVAGTGPATLPASARTAVALFVDSSAIWFEAPQGVLYRISLRDGAVNSEPVFTSTGQGMLISNRLMRLPTGELVYAMHGRGVIYRLDDSRRDQVLFEPFFGPGRAMPATHYFLYRDLRGNTIWISEDPKEGTTAWLMDTEGQVHDFTPVVAALQGTMNQRWNHLELRGTDFTRNVWVVGRDLVSLDVSSRSGVKAHPSGPVRGVVELADGTWVLGRYRTFKSGRETNPDSLLPACFSVMHPDGDILRLGNGMTLHGTRGSGLRLYNRESDDCRTFFEGETVARICIGPDSTVFVLATNRLLSLDLDRKITTSLLDQVVEPFVNALFVSRNGTIYLGTAEGLFKVDRESKTLVSVDTGDYPASQIQCLYEDRQGRLWVGTHSQGLKILDPVTGSVQTVDEDQGLSNNIVAFAHEDRDGDIWIGTYHGITIFDQQARLLGYLYEEGGLVNNECNRWAAYQLSDGDLFIGTPVGFTVVDPSVVKARISQWSAPYAYLSQMTTGKRSVIYGSAEFEQALDEGIVIPASDRSIRINYALSNYASPESSRFAYMLDLPGHDWNYVGALHELNLSDLPAGEYDILIKGYDYTGAESNIARVPLRVNAFFYELWWFYALCSLPFLAFAVIWVRRQKGERRRLEAAVIRRTETIREQAEALRELDQMKTRLYTNITHEFRTPLTVIRGLADHAGDDEKAPELIKRNADNLLGLVNQMLDLRKMESGNLRLQPVQDDLIRFLRYVGESFRSIAETRLQQFHFLSEQEGFVMDFDPEKLTRVVSNLLSNAIKFTPEGGDIYLQVDCSDETAVIKVRDTGIGIPEDKLEHIFERFYQVDDSSTRRGEGTGIGLTLVSEMVRLMGGEISVTSRQGHGSTFTVTLPVSHDAPMEEQVLGDEVIDIGSPVAAVTAADAMTSVEGYASLAEVLVVEDNPDVIHYLTGCLDGSYRLRIAMDGQEGIEKAIGHVPDLVISDVMMPEKNGFELCETLKNHHLTSHIPIILLTARADAESRLKGLSRGADAYLEKPFNKEELLIRIEKLLELRESLRDRYAGSEPPQPTDDPGLQLEDAFIAKVRETLLANLDDPDFGIAEMCQALHIGRTQLHNKITALTGKSTSLYLRQVRLHASRTLLRDPNLNVSEVAYAVGFKDPKYFAKVFKQEYGVTPSEWS